MALVYLTTTTKGDKDVSQLFRKQAVEAQSQRLMGAITLAQPLSLKLTTATILLVVSLTLIYLFNAEYTRKETVQGFLRPDKGLIKSYSNRSGTIQNILVREGQFVKKGTPLINLVSYRSLDNGIELSDKLIQELNQQHKLLIDEKKQLQTLEQQEVKRIKARQEFLLKSKQVIATQQELLREKLSLYQQQQSQFNRLYQQGYVSELEFQQKQERHIVVKQEYENLTRTLIDHQDELSQLNFEFIHTPQKYLTKKRDIERQQSQINRQLTETKNNFSYTVKATHSGVITGIQVVEGETLHNIRPLLTILPEGATLIAELMLPTRSSGFVAEGDIAKLRFDAFPHQRFGFVYGTISRVDKTLITQEESNFPVQLSEPVYRLQAELDHQFIVGYDREFPFKSGMLFSADIILDKRTLIEWMLDPILSVKGRLN
ncbi:HlyD family secretion protein [Thalassotalea marina]|uniref:Toxin secretion, membrane fusion protein n=1 Tax=Thalassotalea marina TaxID=1673741 RepID=A0A919BNZ8_9GAMM|nr:toxin secretion, membrane fusion protein [Thalassotalea marina]